MIKAGAHDYITKPLIPDEVLNVTEVLQIDRKTVYNKIKNYEDSQI